MPYKDPQKQKEAQHRSYLRNKEKIQERQRIRRKKKPTIRAEEYKRRIERLKNEPGAYEKVLESSRVYDKRYRLGPVGKKTREQYLLKTWDTKIKQECIRKYKQRYGKFWQARILANKLKEEIENGNNKNKNRKRGLAKINCEELAKRIMGLDARSNQRKC